MRTKRDRPTRSLEPLVRRINGALAQAVQPPAGSPAPLRQAMQYCVLQGGKRFRPLLCLGASEAAGRDDVASRHSLGSEDRAASVGGYEGVLNVACAIELIHAYSLVHDDLPAMDNADQRRGQASCHRRFGEATAILVGDALLTRAFELLGSNGTPNALIIVRTLAKACGTSGLIGGQLLDLQSAISNQQSAVKQLEEIARQKTAALITASVVTGGLAARASRYTLGRLRRYGEQVGLAFQLFDDLRDQDGLAAVVPSETLRARADRLLAAAMDELAPCGRRAWVLRELAGWLGRIS